LDCYTVRFNQESDPIAIFGIADQGYIGVPWFLATPDVTRGAISILREARHWMKMWLCKYPNGLVNLADTRNTLHLRWIKALGCAFGATTIRNGVPFIFFYYQESSRV